MPLTRVVPQGMSYPYDIKRFYNPYNVKTIFDVGANIGQTSLFLSHHFPQADIFAFEPIKDTYDFFQNNSKKLPKIQPFNYALGSQETQKIIQLRENSQLNTLVNIKNPAILETEKLETVTIKTLDNFCKSNKINKIDILKNGCPRI
jgi:FkbM family methyltransferase